jgi:hypothetical protein
MLSLNTSRAREKEPFVEGGVHVSPKVGLTLTSRHLQGQPKKPIFLPFSFHLCVDVMHFSRSLQFHSNQAVHRVRGTC